MNYKVINEEIYYTTEPISKVTAKDIEHLKSKASQTARKRVRLCTHSGVDDVLHEMLIVHAKGAYVPPHRHIGKIESFHMIEGNLEVVIFNEDGEIHEIIKMAEFNSGKNFYYRLADSRFHSVVPRSDYVVFHEITNGPFDRKDTIFASWAPCEKETEAVAKYQQKLEEQMKKFSG